MERMNNKHPIKTRKKLIEVALPLDAINTAAARAVIFAQMVDDPSDVPELYPSAESQDKRKCLSVAGKGLRDWPHGTPFAFGCAANVVLRGLGLE